MRDLTGTGLSPDPFGLHSEPLGDFVSCQQPFHVADSFARSLFMVAITIAWRNGPAGQVLEKARRISCENRLVAANRRGGRSKGASSAGGKIAER